MPNKTLLKEQIIETAHQLKLSAPTVEKDYHVTRILHLFSEIENEHYKLVFQGGTCLAKAHLIIPRMSEDIDFRIQGRNRELGRYASRKHLREFRKVLVETLRSQNYSLVEKPKVFYEGEYMSLKLQYTSLFYAQAVPGIKSFIAIDFFVGDVKAKIEQKPITTLIQETLGKKAGHAIKNIACLSAVETAAEKWVGLTRRLATIKHREYYNDPTLVRHVYDLYKIHKEKKLDEDFHSLVKKILKSEKEKFKTHNKDYFETPLNEIKRSLQILSTPEWEENWNKFISTMVYEKEPPTFKKALKSFNDISEKCLPKIEGIHGKPLKKQHSKKLRK